MEQRVVEVGEGGIERERMKSEKERTRERRKGDRE